MKNKKVGNSVPAVKLSRLKGIISSVEKVSNGKDIDLSFEYVLASCFPTCWNNIQRDLNSQYTKGYIQGRKDASEKLKK